MAKSIGRIKMMSILTRIRRKIIRMFLSPLDYAKLVGVNMGGGIYTYMDLLIGEVNHGLYL